MTRHQTLRESRWTEYTHFFDVPLSLASYDDVKQWCDENLKDGSRVFTGHDTVFVDIRSDEDAVLFALRFG